MAIKNIFFKNVTVNGALSLQDGGTAPTGAITTTGWTVAKTGADNMSLMAVGVERAATTFSTTDALATPAFSAGSCWRSETAFTGTFASTDWAFVFRVRSVTAVSGGGRMRIRVWKSTNADGTGAIQLTTGVVIGTQTTALSTTISTSANLTWAAPGAITLNNEYLWIQCEWDISQGTSGNNSSDVLFYVESQGRITTPDFVATPNYAQAHFRWRTDATAAEGGTPVWAEPEDVSIPSADYQDVNYRLRVCIQNTGAGAQSNTWTLRYSRNGGAYTPITTTSSVVRAADASTSADGAVVTTQLLSSGAGTFSGTGRYSESGTTISVALPAAGSFQEYEYGIRVVAADVANGDTLDFQVWPDTTGAITRTVTPRLTVAVAAGVSGSGAPAAQRATVAGAGISASAGTGTLVAVAAAVSGSGTVAAAAITGTGALPAGNATVAGVGTSASAGTGALADQAATLAGTGLTASAGVGALAAQAAAVSGVGTSASIGTGALTAGAATVAGAGVSASIGSGTLVAGSAAIAGSGTAVGAGDATAPGATLPLTLALVAGAASGAGQFPPIVIGGSAAYSATAPGALYELWVSLQPGRAIGTIDPRREDATVRGAVLPFSAAIVAGRATGDAVGYDNDLVMLLAA